MSRLPSWSTEQKDDPQLDGWNYKDNPEGGDARKLVTLEQDGMVWVGIRAWSAQEERWVNNNEPEHATVKAWRDLPVPAQGFYDRGILHIQSPLDEIAHEVLNDAPEENQESKFGWKP